MDGKDFERVVESAFDFMVGLGFVARPIEISGRQYLAEFDGRGITLSVSFEPGDEHLAVYVASDGTSLAAIDDPTRTPRLRELNLRYMPSVTPAELGQAQARFDRLVSDDLQERRLIGAAHDLFLVLPRFLGDR